MDPLHGGDDAELAETGDVGVVEELGVLDAEAVVLAPRELAAGGLVGVQDDPVGPVADGVGADLEAAAARAKRAASRSLGRGHQQARVRRGRP